MDSIEKIRLNREGDWFQGDNPITHERTLELFFKSIVHTDEGYFLSGEKMPVAIEVEDTAYFIRGVNRTDSGYTVDLSDATSEELDPKTLSFGEENELYCLVKNGSERAKFLRPAFYEIMKDLTEEASFFGLRVGGLFYPLKSAVVVPEIVPEVKAPAVKVAKPVVATKSSPVPVVKNGAKKVPANKQPAKKATEKKSAKKSPPKKSKKKGVKKVVAKKPVKKAAKKTAKKPAKKPVKKLSKKAAAKKKTKKIAKKKR